jgi:hypothetical protein
MTEDIPNLAEAYARDHPKPKRGRPASTFPSGLTVAELADQMPCCTTLIGRWCLGLRVPDNRTKKFFELAGFEGGEQWEAWKVERNKIEGTE